jgi:hypothetical protein
MTLQQALALLNLAIPGIENVILLFKNANGTTTALISSTQTQNAEDQAAIQAWLASHQNPAAAAKE